MDSVLGQNCTIKKGYAYERSSLSGTPPRKILNESGEQVERPVKNNTTYFIYMETKTNRLVQPTRIWIDGKPFNVISEEIESPVILQYNQPIVSSDTLVKQTKNKIIKLQPKEELTVAPDAKLSKKLKAGEIIIEYNLDSKRHYYTIKKIKKLPPLVLQ